MRNNPTIKKFAPIFIGLGISGLLLIFGFKLFQNAVTRANDISPVSGSVAATNVTQNSASIVWQTSIATQCVVEYNSSLATVASGSFAPEIAKGTTHKVDVTLLAPDTTYYYDIACENKKFNNDGVPYSFKTLSQKASGAQVTTPTPTTTSSTPPTPIPTAVPTQSTGSCTGLTCEQMKAQIGKICTMQAYLKQCFTPTPTLQVAPHATTPTVIATPSPTPTP